MAVVGDDCAHLHVALHAAAQDGVDGLGLVPEAFPVASLQRLLQE